MDEQPQMPPPPMPPPPPQTPLISRRGLLAGMLLLAGSTFAWFRFGRRTDARLLGTWKSDADLTMASLERKSSRDAEREAKLRSLFGKMRITWTATQVTSDLEGYLDTDKYKVLASDTDSVTIQSEETTPSPLDGLGLPTVHVIHFVGADTYWLDISGGSGGMREYFTRVK